MRADLDDTGAVEDDEVGHAHRADAVRHEEDDSGTMQREEV
jgi:hypothetical protein